MAEFTRDQYNETNKVEKKLVPKGAYIVDSDLNEMQDIQINHLRRALSALVNHQNVRVSDGFAVLSTGSNTLAIKKGHCFLQLETHKSVVLWMNSDAVIDGWTTPSGYARTDYVYIDLYMQDYDSDDDPNLINPEVGEETMIDRRLKWEFKKIQGAAVPTAPTGHVYVSLLSIARTAGQATITMSNVTNLLDSWPGFREMIYAQKLEATLGDIAGVVTEWDSTALNCFVENTTSAYEDKIRIAYFKHPWTKRIIGRFEVEGSYVRINLSGGITASVDADVIAQGWSTPSVYQNFVFDISAAADNSFIEIEVQMKASSGASYGSLRKLCIWGTS